MTEFTATHTPVTSITVGSAPYGIAFSPDGAWAFVANYSSDDVSVIDVASHTVSTTIALGRRAWDIAASC